MDVSKIFNKFAGREVSVTEKLEEVCGYKFTNVQINDNNPVLAEIEQEAAAMGLRSVRAWVPGMVSTMDYRTDRLNVRIEKEADGKYRIQNNFNLG